MRKPVVIYPRKLMEERTVGPYIVRFWRDRRGEGESDSYFVEAFDEYARGVHRSAGQDYVDAFAMYQQLAGETLPVLVAMRAHKISS
jgi:hypothetical protein